MGVVTDLPSGALIGGSWVDGGAGTFEVRSPHDGALLNIVARCDVADAARAVAAAKAAQPAWAATPLIDRVKIMRRIHAPFMERAESVARMLSAEIGKTITDAREEVYEYAVPSWNKAGEEVLRHRGMSFPSTQEQTQNKRLVLSHRPLGVVGVITPYNFPTDISSIALAHIVAAGNTAVWKPSEYSPTSCAMVAAILEEAGLPAGVVNLVQGFGDVGAAIVERDDVDGIFFTGSTATGRRIGAAAPLKPHLLELGGDGPFIILADADVDAAVEGALNGCFYYSGQVCTSAERLLVHEAVYDEFLSKFRARTAELVIGDPASEATDMGPFCNVTTLARVKAHVVDARALGAQIEQFGPENELYYPATILTDVTTDMRIMQEETFGPVARILKVSSAAEAVEIANQSKLGLIASLWTRDLATAWRIAEALPPGTFNINETSNYWDQLRRLAVQATVASAVSCHSGSWTRSQRRSCWSSIWATPTSSTTGAPRAAGRRKLRAPHQEAVVACGWFRRAQTAEYDRLRQASREVTGCAAPDPSGRNSRSNPVGQTPHQDSDGAMTRHR